MVYEKWFPEPGCYVRVPFGRFKAELAPQLQAPHDVAPGHLIDCLLQVYRVHQPLPMDRLALVEMNDPGYADRFHVLTGPKAHALGLPVPAEDAPAPTGSETLRVARPGQELWSMAVLFDPTREQRDGQPDVPEADAR